MQIKVALVSQNQEEKLRLLHVGIQVLQAHFPIEMEVLIGEIMSKTASIRGILIQNCRREVQVLDATLSVHGRT